MKKVDINKIECMQLNQAEMELMRTALNIKEEELICYYCKEKVIGKKYGIMPSNNDKPIIICDSPLCMCEYLQEHEKK